MQQYFSLPFFKLKKYFSSAEMDFRRAVPLLQGLHVFFLKKVKYLHADTKNVLEKVPNFIIIQHKDLQKNLGWGSLPVT